MGFWTQLILIIVVLHFVVGFGYLVYKLSPRKKDKHRRDALDKD